MKAKLGLFTPWGRVYCYNCHGNDFPMAKQKRFSDEEFEKFHEEVHLRAGSYYTTCDECGCKVQTTDSVAHVKNMMEDLRLIGINADFEQTGGMNSACILYIKDDTVSYPFDEDIEEEGIFPPVYYVTYNFDGEENEFHICGYDKYNEVIDGKEFSFETYEETFDYIKSLTDIRMI